MPLFFGVLSIHLCNKQFCQISKNHAIFLSKKLLAMRIRPKTRTQIHLILAITLFWMACGAFLALYKCVTYDTISHKFIFMVPQYLALGPFVLINLIGPIIGGLVGGSVLVLVLNEKLNKKSYWFYLLVNFLFFFAFIFILNMAVTYFFYYKDDISNADRPVHEAIQLLL